MDKKIDVSEGLAKIKAFEGKISRKDKVFYNPKMRINRDLSVLLLKAVKNDAKVLDAFAATGIRGMRYLLEAEAKEVVFTDINPNAVELIKENVELNKVKERAKILLKDCRVVMLENANYFDVIDVDPFGSPAPFTDAAASSIRNGGLCFFTATDLSALTGTNRKAGKRKYFVEVHRCDAMHDVAIRGLLSFLSREFAKHGKGIKVTLAYYRLHHIRAFVLCERGRRKADQTLENIANYLFCEKCGFRAFEKHFWESECPICKGKLKVCKNLWIDNYLDPCLIKKMMENAKESGFYSEAYKFLEVLKKESEVMKEEDAMIYDIHYLSKIWKIKEMNSVDKIIEMLHEKGFKAAKSHVKPTAIITNADVKNLVKVIKKK